EVDAAGWHCPQQIAALSQTCDDLQVACTLHPHGAVRFWSVLFVLGCSDGMLVGASPDASVATDSGADIDALPPMAGVRAEYFAGYMDLVLERIEPELNHDWGMGAPDPAVGQTHFSVRWTGSVVAPQNGSYQIITDSDDGVRVWIGDRLVIDDWNGHFVTRNM